MKFIKNVNKTQIYLHHVTNFLLTIFDKEKQWFPKPNFSLIYPEIKMSKLNYYVHMTKKLPILNQHGEKNVIIKKFCTEILKH